MAQQLKTALTILRRKQVEARIQLSRSTIYDRMNPKSSHFDPTFPKSIKLGSGANPPVGWIESEIETWLTRQIEISRASLRGGATA